MRKIRIAQIGLNTFSHSVQIFNTLCKRTDLFEVVGICFPENERERLPGHLEKLCPFVELTLEQILHDPTIEAVTVETDELYLTKYALLAAQNGKQIHMEKPGGTVLSEFEALLGAVKEKGLVFHIGYMYRYNPGIREVLEKVRRGELGEIISVEAQMNCLHTAHIRQWMAELPGGMMFFLGCHLIDLILQIQGLPKRVIPMNKVTGLDDIASQDFGMAVLEYDKGCSFLKTTNVEYGGFLRRQLVITGSKGTVEMKPLEIGKEDALQTRWVEYYASSWSDPGKTTQIGPFDRYDTMMSSFAAMVRGETKNPYTYAYELELYKIILHAVGWNQ